MHSNFSIGSSFLGGKDNKSTVTLYYLTMLGIFSISKIPDANAIYCEGYKTYTAWPGDCMTCDCEWITYSGEKLCDPKESQ